MAAGILGLKKQNSIMERLVLDIRHDRDCPEHVFGTASLRDTRVYPLFRDSDIRSKEVAKAIEAKMTENSILVICAYFDPGDSGMDYHIGLPSRTNRPDEKLMTKIAIHLDSRGQTVGVNETGEEVQLPNEVFSHPVFALSVSRKLVEGPSGDFDYSKAVHVQGILNELFGLLLAS